MQKIKFNINAAQTALFEGPFESREALVGACETVTLPYGDYHAWAQVNAIDPATGSIITSAYSPDYVTRRIQTLELQARSFTQGVEPEGLKITVPSLLTAAFTSAAQGHPARKQFRMLDITTTKENLAFDLRRSFPGLNLHATYAAANSRQTTLSNTKISSHAPSMAQNLIYAHRWQNRPYDLAQVNYAMIYEDEAGVRRMIHEIVNTGAERVVFSNMINSSGEESEWYGQRSRGGVVPVRALIPEEIRTVMEMTGYRLVDRDTTPCAYKVLSETGISTPLKMDNLSFIREHAAA